MTHRKRRPQRPPTRKSGGQLPSSPSLAELENFSDAGLRQWRNGWERYRDLYSELYFGLERQRAQYVDEMTDALLKNAAQSVPLRGWARIVDYQYALAPLSTAGSLIAEGGRFNIGKRLNPASFAPFGALYVADSHAAAFAEKFSVRQDEMRDGLSAGDLTLRAPTSYSFVALDGLVEHCFDVSDRGSLEDFVQVIAKFKMPQRVMQLARAVKKIPPTLIRTAGRLQSELLLPNWNVLPMHFSLPSNAQIFGRSLHAAGFHGVAYTSARGPGRCLALFPDNWRGSQSEVHVVGKTPSEARLVRIEGTTSVFE